MTSRTLSILCRCFSCNKDWWSLKPCLPSLGALTGDGGDLQFGCPPCSKKTVELIITQGNDYVIQVKANQKTLQQQLQQQAELSLFRVDLQQERTRDRQTTRIATVFELSEDIKAAWTGAQLGIEVIRQGPARGNPMRNGITTSPVGALERMPCKLGFAPIGALRIPCIESKMSS